MKKVFGTFARIFAAILSVISVCIMLFTVVSVLTFNRTDRELFGYKMFIVLSDSMSATDFSAGDLVLTRDVDPSTLQPGDIIAFTSSNDENYGQTVTHKIRELTTTDDGEPGFITYGTTTGIDDSTVVTYPYVVGKYEGSIPKVGRLFQFLKTTTGYIICIFLPFLLLILMEGLRCVRLFRQYKKEQQTELQKERDQLREEREETQRMMQELMEMKQKLNNGAAVEPTAPVQPAPQPVAKPAAQSAVKPVVPADDDDVDDFLDDDLRALLKPYDNNDPKM